MPGSEWYGRVTRSTGRKTQDPPLFVSVTNFQLLYYAPVFVVFVISAYCLGMPAI